MILDHDLRWRDDARRAARIPIRLRYLLAHGMPVVATRGPQAGTVMHAALGLQCARGGSWSLYAERTEHYGVLPIPVHSDAPAILREVGALALDRTDDAGTLFYRLAP